MNYSKLNTEGLSYDYNLPRTYTGTSSSSYPCYNKLAQYNVCPAGKIIPPTPTSVIPEIFYHNSPHKFKVRVPGNAMFPYNNSLYVTYEGSKDSQIFGYANDPNSTQYAQIYQTPYIWGGWANEPQTSLESNYY